MVSSITTADAEVISGPWGQPLMELVVMVDAAAAVTAVVSSAAYIGVWNIMEAEIPNARKAAVNLDFFIIYTTPVYV